MNSHMGAPMTDRMASQSETPEAESLTGILAAAAKELSQAHDLLDSIEAGLFGPSPSEESAMKGHPGGMENSLYEVRASASSANARLDRIKEWLG